MDVIDHIILVNPARIQMPAGKEQIVPIKCSLGIVAPFFQMLDKSILFVMQIDFAIGAIMPLAFIKAIADCNMLWEILILEYIILNLLIN